MPKYRITAPDGQTYEVTAPEGASEQDVLAYAQANYQRAAQHRIAQNNIQAVPSPASPEYPSVLSPEFERRAGGDLWGRFKYSASQVMPSLFKGDAGIRDRALEAVPGSRIEKGPDGSEIVVTPEGERFYVNKPGLDVDDVFRFAGQVAAFTPAGRVVRAATVPGRVVQAGAGAAATDVVGQAASGQGVDLDQTALSGLVGGAGQGAADALIKSGKAAAQAVTPELRRLYQTARAKGIDLQPWQLTDSKFVQYVRKQLAALPASGAAGKQARQNEAFSRQVAATVGESGPMNQETYAKALTRLGDEFEKFTTRHNVPMTDDFMERILKVQDEAASVGDDNAMRAMRHFANRIFQQGNAGTLSGKAFGSIDSELAKVQAMGGEKAHYASKMRDALHDQLERVLPRDQFEAWQKARGQYRNLMRLTPLVARDDAVSPGKLMSAVTGTKSDKRAMAQGRGGELGELARIGQRMKPPGTSGTPEGVQSAAVGYGLMSNPLGTVTSLLGGRAALSVLDSNVLARLLMREGRGQTRQLVAPYLQRAAAPGGTYGTSERESDDRRNRP